MPRLTTASALSSLLLLLAASPATARAQGTYRLESVVTLPGKSPSWDYLSLEAARSRLFIGRRGAGVTVFDVAQGKAIAVIGRSEGANATALVPALDRGFTANEDGSSTMFELSTLKTLDRIALGTDADAAVYEPATRQVAFTMGDSKRLTFVDARTGAITGRLALASSKLDGAAPDGAGNLFVAERDRNAVVRVDARARRATAEWKIPGCSEPTGLAMDSTSRRIFVGCRGRDPVLAVLDSRSGRLVARLPIGRGNDGVIFDAGSHRVITSNGVDANIVIYDQLTPDRYRLADAPTTRPFARTMALDPATKRLYLVTAEGTVDTSKPAKTTVSAFYPNRYFDDSFIVLTYALR